jgi:hypothetical protein
MIEQPKNDNIIDFVKIVNDLKKVRSLTPPFPMYWPVGSNPSKDQYIGFVIDWYYHNVDLLEIYENLFPEIAKQYDDLEKQAEDFLRRTAAFEYDNVPTTNMLFSELFSDIAYRQKIYYLKTVFNWSDKDIDKEMKRTCDIIQR